MPLGPSLPLRRLLPAAEAPIRRLRGICDAFWTSSPFTKTTACNWGSYLGLRGISDASWTSSLFTKAAAEAPIWRLSDDSRCLAPAQPLRRFPSRDINVADQGVCAKLHREV